MFAARRCVPRSGVSTSLLFKPRMAMMSTQTPSSSQTTTPATVTAEQKADAIINFFPGSTPLTKAGSLLASASIAAYLISKEIYVFDAEVYEVFAIFGAYYIWYKGGKDSALAYFKDRHAQIVNVLSQARKDHRAVVQERIDHVGKLSDIVPVTDALYDMSKDIAKFEAQVYELEQKIKVKTQIKSALDAWVRYEANVREQEQKQLAESVIEKVKQQLKDPKLQNNLLQQTIADFDKLATKSA